MKKRIISIMAVTALLFSPVFIQPVRSQIAIMDDEEEEENDRAETEGEGLEIPAVPELGLTIDQYAPLGGEIFVLGCLGGAYLLGKRRKTK